MRKRKTIKTETEEITVAQGVKIFLNTARLDLVNAIKTNCRRKFPKTVEQLDSLSESELSAIKNGGLLALPQPRISSLENAMKADNFKWA